MGYNTKEEMWEKLIDELAESGKLQAEWCKEKEITLSTLKYWVRKLSPKTKSIENQSVSKESAWLKVDVKPEAVSMPQSFDKIELCIGKFRVLLPESFNKESIASVIEVTNY